MYKEEANFQSNEDPDYSDFEIFKYIWTKPRSIFLFLHVHDYDRFLYVLLFFAGVSRTIDRAVVKSMGDQYPVSTIIIMSVFMGGLVGLLTFYLYAAMLSWTGKWVGGRVRAKALYRVLAYALLPSILFLTVQIPMILLFGRDYFQFDFLFNDPSAFRFSIYIASIVIQVILGGWSIVLLVIGVSETQEVSIGKAILNVLLPMLIVFVPIFLIASLYFTVTGLFVG